MSPLIVLLSLISLLLGITIAITVLFGWEQWFGSFGGVQRTRKRLGTGIGTLRKKSMVCDVEKLGDLKSEC